MPAASSSGQDGSKPAKADAEPPSGRPSERKPPTGRYLFKLSIATLGVVYGDIGTSPLYALRECFTGHIHLEVNRENVLGILSLVFWSLVLVVSVKYLGLILRADNQGEGGILSLTALVQKVRGRTAKGGLGILALGVFGAALLYGDGIITPAISVLSAVEGVAVFQPAFTQWVVPLTVAILIGLFLLQRRGTAGIGAIFGPVTFLWFLSLAALGIRGILIDPGVLWALSPTHGVRFFLLNGWTGFLVLGAVFLAVTGSEALYADMGHFGRRPVRLTWFVIVFPALMLNYLGQGALILTSPKAAENPFYLLAPSWFLLPLVGIATLAACVASQAVISSAFSLTRQAVQLGFFPRIEIVHTSATEIGQIYVPFVNWALLVGIVFLVLGFGSSSNLASAYGIAVASTMVATGVLAFVVAKDYWKWKLPVAILVFGVFLSIDFAFLAANLVKLVDGGWFPLLLAGSIFLLMTTWNRGRAILVERLREATVPLELFLNDLKNSPPARVPGTAVFMTGNPDGTPPALLHNFKHNKVVHQRVVLLTVETGQVPHFGTEKRVEVQELEHGFFRVIARYGYMETPSVPDLLRQLPRKGLELKLRDTSFFLGRETLIPSKRKGMSVWRKAIFGWMSKNSRPATAYFALPPNRVVELGAQVEL